MGFKNYDVRLDEEQGGCGTLPWVLVLIEVPLEQIDDPHSQGSW